ncbi:MAG: hypothetical protein KatS3mg022_3385 [Armatimonadota bacterium]|nr:MAG: hypothetical protein KatS3mg022_3385 [Armatimonadota bacterium]
MAIRVRTAEGDLGKRGYEIRILRSDDGIHFVKVHSLKREQISTIGLERPALLVEPHTDKFKLYVCGQLTREWTRSYGCMQKWKNRTAPMQPDYIG